MKYSKSSIVQKIRRQWNQIIHTFESKTKQERRREFDLICETLLRDMETYGIEDCAITSGKIQAGAITAGKVDAKNMDAGFDFIGPIFFPKGPQE